jgi:ligand-binding sensor domain-containing protein
MTTQAQLTLLDSPERNRPGNGEERTEVLHWDGRLDNRDDLLLRLKEPLRGATGNAALALAAYERWGTGGGGVAYFKDGQVRAQYAAADGLGEGRVTGLQLDRDGALWAATGGGLSRVKDGRVAAMTSRNGLPCDTVHWTIEDDGHSFWL